MFENLEVDSFMLKYYKNLYFENTTKNFPIDIIKELNNYKQRKRILIEKIQPKTVWK